MSMGGKCEKCGAKLRRPKVNHPIAVRLWIAYVGRGLYLIAGHPGLWFCQRKRNDPESEVVFARGPMGEGAFYRAIEAEERIKQAMGQQAVATIGEGDPCET
jgi:hypothetical protein